MRHEFEDFQEQGGTEICSTNPPNLKLEALEETAGKATKVCIGLTLVIFFNFILTAKLLDGLIENSKWRIFAKVVIFSMPLLLTYWIMVALR